MNATAIALTCFAAPQLHSSDPLVLEVHLESPERISIDFGLAPEWTVPRNPLLPAAPPAAIVRLDPPPGVVVAGRRPQTLSEEIAALFLDLPEERLIEPGRNEIVLVRDGAHGAEQVLGLDVVLYVIPIEESERSESTRLVRRRLELPLEPGARAVPVPATTSAVGGRDGWRIGERVSGFRMTTPQGELELSDLLGTGPLVVTTQRSCL